MLNDDEINDFVEAEVPKKNQFEEKKESCLD